MLLLLLGIALTTPFVQTKLAHYAMGKLHEQYGVNIAIERVKIGLFGSVKLQEVMVRDHHADTLIYSTRINTNIKNAQSLLEGNLIFGDLSAEHLFVNYKTYKGESNANMDLFFKSFDNGKPSSGKFLMLVDQIKLHEGRFRLTDENNLSSPKVLDFTEMNALVKDFEIKGPNIKANIRDLYMKDFRGLLLEDLETQFAYTKKDIRLDEMRLKTSNSELIGNVTLAYEDGTMKDFSNRVNLLIDLDKKSKINSDDIRLFYDRLGANNTIDIETKLRGTLNNFVLKETVMKDEFGTVVTGELTFKNLFRTKEQPFEINIVTPHLSTSYQALVNFLPGVLQESLPSFLVRLGKTAFIGSATVSDSWLKADLALMSSIGNAKADFTLNDFSSPEFMKYKGVISTNQFNLGKLIKNDLLRTVTGTVNLDGAGVTQESINTYVKGHLDQVYLNGYNYKKIDVNGHLMAPVYDGIVNINDPNLFMDFEGKIDLSSKENSYQFRTKIDYADLHAIQLNKNDTISIVKGQIVGDFKGNSLNTMYGNVQFDNLSYQNERDIYNFNSITLNSEFSEEGVRRTEFLSPDIMEGSLVGSYNINELDKIIENALGSVYANYHPNKVQPGQYLNFNFSIYNKLIEIFFPDLSLGKDTFIRGRINADLNDFRMNFESPEIKLYKNKFEGVNFRIDNQNPLYNAYMSIDSIKTGIYKIADFNVINVTKNDTLFVHTEFKGGEKMKDYYDLNLYHTIDPEKRSIVGFDKSQIHIGDYVWYLNEEEDMGNNKIYINQNFNGFYFRNLRLSHEDQFVQFAGVIRDKYKSLNLNFRDVELGKLLPNLEKFKIEGKVNGVADLMQEGEEFRPYSSLVIDNLNINNAALGDMKVNVEGDEEFKNFNVNAVLTRDEMRSLDLGGLISFVDGETVMDLDMRLSEFNIGAFANIGGDILSNLKGKLSGRSTFKGKISDPEMEGRLFLNGGGFGVPYLGVNYILDDHTIIDLTRRQFLLRNISLEDTEFKTKGNLSGSIRHSNLSNWRMDITVSSDYLNVLNTSYTEEAIYYGQAFIKGQASLTGPVDALIIAVEAESKKGTAIKLPISNTQTIGDNSYIRFITPEEKFNQNGEEIVYNRKFNGLEMAFDLTLTPEAEIEVILDKETGHLMRGRGNGNLSLQINTLGKFVMNGDFQVHEGLYDFKYRGIINKQLKLKEYGSIVWEGDPLRARLNLEALYDNVKANPAVLLDNPSLNQRVPVEVTIGITGNLLNPELDFGIDFPTVSSVLKSEIQTRLDDKSTRQTQALYLLASGNFISEIGGVGNNAVQNNLIETFSGMFNDLFNDDDDTNMNVGLLLTSADRTPGREMDGSVGITGSFDINDRISFYGRLGVPIGGINDNTVVGDIEVLYRVNKDGSLNLRAFNRENDITYVGESIGYTKGVGLTYQVGFKSFKELLFKVFNKASQATEKKSNSQLPDSDMSREFIQFTNERNRGQYKPENLVPEED